VQRILIYSPKLLCTKPVKPEDKVKIIHADEFKKDEKYDGNQYLLEMFRLNIRVLSYCR
jgi:hypothetical protein